MASERLADPYPRLDTPSLVVRLDALERNLDEMATVAREGGVRLRPHTKTHKCPEIAAMQVAAGAAGITVAKLGEAEVMADTGLDDILVAYPIVGDAKLERLTALLDRARVRVSLDSVEVAEGIGLVGAARGEPVEVLVEVDTGQHRMGRPPGAASAELASAVAEVPGVEIVGLITHEGHSYAARATSEIEDVIERVVADLLDTKARCEEAGLSIREISVGSTPTARAAATVAGVTEIRPGTYVFNDVQQMRAGVATEDTCAMRILTTVVARPWGDRFVIDAGSKSFSQDGTLDPPFPGRGVVAGRPDLRIDFFTEEHGVGHVETDGRAPDIGDRLEIVPLHVCSAVNLFDVAYGVRDGDVEHEFRIEARGKVR